jgi:hypothetical protein
MPTTEVQANHGPVARDDREIAQIGGVVVCLTEVGVAAASFMVNMTVLLTRWSR